MRRPALPGPGTLALTLVLTLAPTLAVARVNPLRVITERIMRSEILIVLDTSGSMAWYPNPSYSSGTDCGGSRVGTVDLCGDGVCSGGEKTTSCSTDCNISSGSTSTAGSPPACESSYTNYNSRMFIIKRVLGNLLPPLRKSGNFGLVTFYQSGYFRYYRGTSGTSRKVSVFFSKTEMESLGAWDSTNSQPRTSFTWNGTTYTLLSSAGMSVTADSLYSRADDSSQENRFSFSTAGTTYSSGSYTWAYRGSYYTYTQVPTNIGSVSIQSQYRGPQFVDSSGVTWIYYRYSGNYTTGISYGSTGLVVVPLNPDQSQSAQDLAMYHIIQRMNLASNGGLVASGGTPTGPAIQAAHQHFLQRHQGTGTFASVGKDPSRECRPRFVLVLTDGDSNAGIDPWYAADNLYSDPIFGSNHVKTLVVGLPGLASQFVAKLDRIADMGDDGVENKSKTAYTATDETSLIKVVREALLEMVSGDFTTTASGVTSSSSGTVEDDLALVPSTEFPGWKGHLRALDLTQGTSTEMEIWEAGLVLNSTDYKSRKIYTGFPTTNSGVPVPLLASNGTVNLNGSCSGCGGFGVKDVWSVMVGGSTSLPQDTEVTATVEWLVGKGRSWKLGPIFRSIPAVIGPPPKYYVADHDNYKSTYSTREKLIYITSNDGILHAFRATDGSEAFGYVPGNLWPKIYELWRRGGQDADPANFRWILAASPRVEDIPVNCTPCQWATQLVLTMGPGDKALVALDITDPSSCSGAKCQVRDPPFKILKHSKDLSMSSVIGETWSTPALFYEVATAGKPTGEMGMGSGYGNGNQGYYYNFFPSLYVKPSSTLHSPSGPLVDYAVLTDTVAVIDYDNERRIIATYQGDLNGRIMRYDGGSTSAAASTIISTDAKNPFYFSPAAYHQGSETVLLAAVSNSAEEESPPSSLETKLYMRSESNGTVNASDELTCPVSSLCGGGSGCPDEVPTLCTAPSSKATPVCPPLLVKNSVAGASDEYEAFYLFYDPPTSACSTGSSWLVRIASGGSTQKLIQSVEYADVRASGMTVVGGGRDVIITTTGLQGKKAGTKALMNNITNTTVIGGTPVIEAWREVK